MLIETWFTFSIAALLIIIIPGPTILLVISQSFIYGSRAALPLVVGVFFGDLVAMLCSMLGLGVLMATSAVLFSIVKWIGAAYLLYLGISLWRIPVENTQNIEHSSKATAWQLARQAFLVTVLNPKGIVFFLAFLPQFVEPSTPVAPQLLIMGTTFLVFAVISAACYALFSSRVRKVFGQPKIRKWFNRTGGSVLIGAAMFTVTVRQ